MSVTTLDANALTARAREIVEALPDPEIPSLTLADLGVIQSVVYSDESCNVRVTPTYSACPATEFIQQSIVEALQAAGFAHVKVETVLAPAWSSAWLSARAREKLRGEGIAPPCLASELALSRAADQANELATIRCPRCDSAMSKRLSEFGATPCQALYRCTQCREPFGYFKPI